MKIGIDTRELSGNKAGIGWYIYHVLKNILEQDSKNNYIAYSEEKIDFPDFPNLKKVIVPQKGLTWHYATAKKIETEKLDLYWSTSSPIIPAITKVPTILTIYDLTNILFPRYHRLKGRLIDKIFLKKAIRKAKKIITISEATKNDISKLFPLAKEKIFVTYLGFDQTFQPLPDKTIDEKLKRLDLKRGYVLFVGTLEPRKNIESILKAYSTLSSNLQKEYPLVIAGKKGWKYEKIFETYEQLQLKDKVKFLDYVDFADLPALYNGASVFVFLSFYEGFGLPPLEAMACGTPVIFSNISSLPEVVGDAGIKVNPLNTIAIVKNIEKILTDDNLRQQYSKLSAEQSHKFSWQKTAAETLKIFK